MTTLLEYLTAQRGMFLSGGGQTWSADELRVCLLAVQMGAPAEHEAFPKGAAVFLSAGDDTTATPVPDDIDAHVRVPARINLEMRERIRARGAKGEAP